MDEGSASLALGATHERRPTAVHPLMLLVALIVALAVGIGFGFYPAWHAAGLVPMDALRRE